MILKNIIFSNLSTEDKALQVALKNILGFKPSYLHFYVTAITHRSKIEVLSHNNERLEFLGDAFLGSIVGEYLFKKYPQKDEGYLTEMRSKIVSRQSLNEIALKMGLQKILRYNSQDRMLKRSNIFGNALEALVGAIYLDKGFKKTKMFLLNNMIANYVDIEDLEVTEYNFKNKLFTWAQHNDKVLEFRTLGESSEAGRHVFTVGIFVDNILRLQATGYNKKKASQTAAEKALKAIEEHSFVVQDLEDLSDTDAPEILDTNLETDDEIV